MTDWPRVRLGDVLSLEYGKSLPARTRDPLGEYPVAGSNGPDGKHTTALVSSPGIVVGRKGSAGRVYWYDNDFWPIDTTYYVVPRMSLEIRWAYYLLSRLRLDRFATTTGVPGLNRNDAYGLEISLPPRSEQRRIVEILDQADRLRRRRSEADAKSERVIPSLFIKMFGDPAVNPMRWPCRSLSDLAIRFSDGPFGSNLKTSHYRTDGVRVLRLQNVGVGKLLDDDKAFVSPDHFTSLLKHECLPGDAIVATLGDPNLRAFVVPSHIPRALNKADCVQIRPKPGSAVAEYICWLLNAPSTVRMAERLMHGQTRTRIGMGLLKNLSVPVPEYEIQARFASHVRAANEVVAMREQTDEKVTALWNVLRHAAFNRRLTASWRKAHMTDLLQEMEQ